MAGISALQKLLDNQLASRFFRFSDKNSPMSDWGHAMFAKADTPQEADEILSMYGTNVYELFPSEKYPNVSELKNDILKAYAKSFKAGTLPDDMARLVRDGEYKADVFFEQFAPDDIVVSARAYDSEDYLPWFWENVMEPKGLDGVITPDGAISFNSDDIKKIYTKPDRYDGIPDTVKGILPLAGAGATAAALAPSSAEAAQRGGASSEFWPAMARQFGLGTRGVIEGLGTGATLGFGDPGRWVADAFGLPSPETDIERQRVGLNAGVTDALTTFAGGAGAAKMAANPVVRGVGMELADKPLLGAGIGGLLGLLGYDYEEE